MLRKSSSVRRWTCKSYIVFSAKFVWLGDRVTMRRDNLFRNVRDVGLGLMNLFLTRLVFPVFLFTGQVAPLFCNMSYRESWRDICLISLCPLIWISHRGLLVFFKKVVEIFQILRLFFSMDYISGVSRRLLQNLRYTCFPVPLYPSLFASNPGQDVLSRVKKMCIPSRIKAFLFKLHSATLPVKAWMKQKYNFVP